MVTRYPLNKIPLWQAYNVRSDRGPHLQGGKVDSLHIEQVLKGDFLT
jgi:hypothetical protein